jgi:hypothetical protein
MNLAYQSTLAICQLHAQRLQWAMQYLSKNFPMNANDLQQLNDLELAVLDQFSTRFAKLQDTMGAKLFPAVLELTKEQGQLTVFLDKLYRLEKIGAIASADNWLLLREMRNEFSHDYPLDSELQTAILNKAYTLASDLLDTLSHIETFAQAYIE